MRRSIILIAYILWTTAGAAQSTPGEQFLQNWDLDGDGIATLEELRGMRGDVFFTFDSNEDGYLDGEEYLYFDMARANDVANYEAVERAQMQEVADGMSLLVSDLDGDGQVSEAEFMRDTETWFSDLDTDGNGGITLSDFAR